ncbi:MAG: hypothetical protein A3D35_03540 [Candidatus Staskawiczbacteria bacterium RIFCSPHIGHO2_02_FULL_34_9]|uniref:Uncharacterized protein n=1 Tax=Candidatus Staskawiczbacteria bacterium RIFCSPHIGHO2_02_FULL_34_9 TaxID=1802206 RepID=A0A1G2HXA3_9BACT|nr:MAG: hypothetical protein A3D35_03540 [Candidatus Staskawiczbacteria bacterium RIFCSPHIGHO2_02_FULL_34_9]
MRSEVPPSSLIDKGVKRLMVMEDVDRINPSSSDLFDLEKIIPMFFDIGSFYMTKEGAVIFCCSFFDDPDHIFEYRRVPLRADLEHWFNREVLNPLKSPVALVK